MNKTAKLINPKLSYKIIGLCFDVFNELGFGLQEKYYQRSLETLFIKEKINYEREKYIKLKFENKSIGGYYLDFVIENKIILELKTKPRMGYIHLKQVVNYLKVTNLELAILIYFTKDGVKYRRIINRH